MFGGQGLYHGDVMTALVMGDELFLKTDASTLDVFREAGGQPFIYQGKHKPVGMSYWLPPAEAMESAQAMQPWTRLAYRAALRNKMQTQATGRKSWVKKPAMKKPAGKKPPGRKPRVAD